MSVARRFLVAPSLVRLIRKERGGGRITEGFFQPQGGRTSYVRVEGGQCQLVLVTGGNGQPVSEEHTDVPRAHGDALLDVCAGKVSYDRTGVTLGSNVEVLVDRYVAPGSLDTVSVVFENAEAAQNFAVPTWFGSEVTNDPAYESRGIALQGTPTPGEVPLTNAALEATLDLFDHRFGLGARYTVPQRPAGSAEGTPAPRRSATPPQEPVPAPKAEAAMPEAPPMPVAATADLEPAEADRNNDARIDDVIESLSQALGATLPQGKESAQNEETPAPFERWTVRQRRTQQS